MATLLSFLPANGISWFSVPRPRGYGLGDRCGGKGTTEEPQMRLAPKKELLFLCPVSPLPARAGADLTG